MLPKYLSAGCGITVERRYSDINPIIVISPAGEVIGYRLQEQKGVKQDGCRTIPATPGTRKALNRLAREQIKLRLLADIRSDLAVCEIEGWDKAEYLSEIKNMIDELGGGENA